MKSINIAMICLVVLVTATPGYSQGILIVQKETHNGQSSTNEVKLDKNHMRAETQASGEATAVIFDVTKQVISMVNIDKKTYREMTKADLDQMKKQMDSAIAQMQEQLKNLPPAQRQMVEQMMRGRGGLPGSTPTMALPKVEYRAAGSDKVGQWSCTKYDGYSGQQKTSEVCTVDPKDFGLTPADFDVARQLSEFMKTLAPNVGSQMPVYGVAQDQGFTGIPVRRISYQDGKIQSTMEITEVRRASFPESTFEVPAGYRKERQ